MFCKLNIETGFRAPLKDHSIFMALHAQFIKWNVKRDEVFEKYENLYQDLNP